MIKLILNATKLVRALRLETVSSSRLKSGLSISGKSGLTTVSTSICELKALASMVPGVKPQPICFPFKFGGGIPERVVIVGGEASNRAIMQELYNRDERRPVVTMGGGTKNVSRADLLRRRITTTFEELMDLKSYQFFNRALYFPGMFEDRVFNNQIGFGVFEKAHKFYNQVKWFQRPIVLDNCLKKLQEGDDILNIFSIVPNIGIREIFPNQLMAGLAITHAFIEGSSLREKIFKLVITGAFWDLDLKPPKGILRVEESSSFEVSKPVSDFWIDGDTINEQVQPGVIRRAPYPIPFMALV